MVFNSQLQATNNLGIHNNRTVCNNHQQTWYPQQPYGMQDLPLGQQQPGYPQPQHAWHAASPSGPATTPTTVWRAIDSLGTRLEATQISIVPLFVPS